MKELISRKKLIFLSIILILLVIASIYATYAINVYYEETTPTEYDMALNFELSNSVDRQVTVAAGKKKIFDIEVTNPYTDAVRYGVAYTMISPTTLPSDVIIAQLSTSVNTAQGLVEKNNTSVITIIVVNDSNSEVTTTFSVINGYKNGGNLIVPSTKRLVVDIYELSSGNVDSGGASDSTAPTDPILDIDENFQVTISGSSDESTPDSEIVYYYSTDNNNFTQGTNLTLTNGQTVYAYAEDTDGNVSNTVSKTLTTSNPSSGTTNSKYYCSHNESYQDSATCTSSGTTSYTGETKYYCSHDGTYQTSSTCSQPTTYTGATRYKCGSSYQTSSTCTSSYTSTTVRYLCNGSYQTSSSCTSNYTGTTKYECPDGTYQTSSACSAANIVTVRDQTVPCTGASTNYWWVQTGSGSGATSCSSYNLGVSCNEANVGLTRKECWFENGTAQGQYWGYRYDSCQRHVTSGTYGSPSCLTNCNSNVSCPSGYTKGTATKTTTCGGYTGSCTSAASCADTWTAPCTATGTKVYYCSHNSSYQSSSTCSQTTTGTKYYYCSETDTYQTSSSCQSTYTGDKYYYCSQTKTYQTSSTCSGTETYDGTKKYYCSHNNSYQDSQTCTQSGTSNYTGVQKYYCSLTKQYYDTQAEATAACTNSCASGTFSQAKGQCYTFE